MQRGLSSLLVGCVGLLGCGDANERARSRTVDAMAGEAGVGGAQATAGGATAIGGSSEPVAGSAAAGTDGGANSASGGVAESSGGSEEIAGGVGGGSAGEGATAGWHSGGSISEGGAGAGPEGGSDGTPSCDSDCDDGNPCTADRCERVYQSARSAAVVQESVGGCRHDPIADGVRCEDQDPCTSGDACLGGQCLGTPTASTPRVLGTVSGYGGFRETNAPFQGVSLVLSESLVVFADALDGGTLLSLVRVSSESPPRLLHQLTTFPAVAAGAVSSWLWHYVPMTNLHAVTPERFVLSGVPYENEYYAGVFDVVDDRLVERSQLSEGRVSTAQTAGRGDRLFRTSFKGLVEYRVSRDGVLETVASYSGTGVFSLVELQFSTDGSTLYGASLTGLKRWDVSASEPVALDTLWPARPMLGLDVNESYLVLQEIEATTKGSVFVYRAADLQPVARFEADETNQPLGFALIGAGKIAIEWDRQEGSSRKLVSSLYSLAGDGAELTNELVVWNRCCDDLRILDPVRFGVGESLLVLAPFQQIVRVGDSGTQERVLAAEQGNLSFIRTLDANTFVAGDAYSSHVVDISDPSAPRLLEGSALSQTDTSALQIHGPNDSGSAQLLNPGSSMPLASSSGGVVTMLASGKGQELRAALVTGLDGTESRVLVARNELYQLSREPESTYRLRRYSLDGSHARNALTLIGEFRVVFAPSDLVEPIHYSFAVDEDTGEIALLEKGGPDASPSVLHWLAGADAGAVLQSNELQVLASHRTEQSQGVADMGFRRGRVAIVQSLVARIFSLADGKIELLAERGPWAGATPIRYPFETLVDFDGKDLYVVERDYEMGLLGLSVYDATSFEQRARYRTPSWPRSLARVGDKLVIGGDATLTIAAPACSVPEP